MNSLRFCFPLIVSLFVAVLAIGGCSRFAQGIWQPAGNEMAFEGVPNPLPIGLLPRELVMEVVSDEVENYFRIIREQHIRLTGDLLTEGFIDTEPKTGSTILEPWRKDSTAGFELAHASLQSVRRWAKVRIIPAADQYLIDVRVYKELEDLEQPAGSAVSGQALRYDNSLDRDRVDREFVQPNRGWIPAGRDFSLEQEILSHLQAQFNQIAAKGPDGFR